MNYEAIVVAAGNSTRSGLNYNKVLFEINKQPIVYLSTKPFIDDLQCNKIFVVCKNSDLEAMEKIFKNERKVSFVEGGATRQQSVLNALKKVKSEYVFIHDGARPFFTSILLNRLKVKLKECNVVIPVWSMVDTVKLVKNDVVVKTLKREELKCVQTPQAFKTNVIKKAHEVAKRMDYTDDSSMVEELTEEKIYVIDGEYTNKKFTIKEDF